MAYLIKTGSNQSLVSLEAFVPQPRCPGLQYTSSQMVGDRSTVHDGPFFYLLWNILKSPAAYQAILALSGLSSSETAAVTVYGPTRAFGMARYNAIVHYPLTGQEVDRSNYRIRDLRLLFTDLVYLP